MIVSEIVRLNVNVIVTSGSVTTLPAKKATNTIPIVMTWVADRVAPYKKVRAVEILDQIPKSPSGKILRRVLVERERGASRVAPTR